MSIFDVTPSHISKMRKGTQDSPYVSIEETRQVVGNIVILREIPNKFEKVNVEDSSGNSLYEVERYPQTSSEYKVDYETGVVNFSSDNNNNEFVFSYQGIGISLININRIFTEYEGDTVLSTLEDNIKGSLETLNELYENVDDWNDWFDGTQDQWEAWLSETEDEWEDWFENIQSQSPASQGDLDQQVNNFNNHLTSSEPHKYGERYSFKYNPDKDTLDLVVY